MNRNNPRRNLLLAEMGIQQWQLCHPERLKGSVNIPLSEQIALVIASENPVNLQAPFFSDVLRSLDLTVERCLVVNPEQVDYLQLNSSSVYCWQIGEREEKAEESKQEKITPHFADFWQTESLEQLKNNPKAKRQLWQKMQKFALSE